MTIREPIDRYISSTKLNCPERVDQAFAARTKANIDDFVGRLGIPLGFKLVYTPTRRAERVGIGGRNWLIYDQYLGQTMNLLNRIFIEATDPQASITYFHKYFAERSLDLGCPIMGVALANIYEDGRAVLEPRRVDEIWRGVLTHVQETFAIYHELGHEAINSDRAYVSGLKGDIAELIEHRRKTFIAQTPEAVLESYKHADPAAHHHVDFETFEATTKWAHESDYGKKVHAGYLAQLDDPDTAVEMFCDAVGVDGSLARTEGFIPIERAIRAIYIGSYHLRTMALVDWHCLQLLHYGAKQHELEERDQRQLQRIQVRNHLLKAYLLLSYEEQLHRQGARDIEARTREMERTLLLDQNRYYEAILDPVGGFLSFIGKDGQLEDFAGRVLENFPDRDDADMTHLTATLAILQQTGWPASLVQGQIEAALLATV